MSNEIITDLKAAFEGTTESITSIVSALEAFSKVMTDADTAVESFIQAEDDLLNKVSELETAFGLNTSTIDELNKKSEALHVTLYSNLDAISSSKEKSDLMRASVTELTAEYVKFGVEIPPKLQDVTDHLDSTWGSTMGLGDALNTLRDVTGTFATSLDLVKERLEAAGFEYAGFLDVLKDSTAALADGFERAVKLSEGLKQLGAFMGPMKKQFKALKDSGSGSFAALSTVFVGSMTTMKATWKAMPKHMKFAIGLIGMELAIRALNWFSSKLSEAAEKGMARIVKEAAIEKKAFDDIRLLRDAKRRQGAEHVAAFLKEIKDKRKALLDQGKTAGEAAIIMANEMKKEIDTVKKANAEEAKYLAALEAHKKAVSDLSAQYGIYTGKHLDDLKIKQKTMIGVWDESKDKILNNADSTKRFLESLKQMKTGLGEAADKTKLDNMIRQLERANAQFERRQAIEKYTKSLGFLKKSDISKELNYMTVSLKKNADQYERNPKLIEPLLKKIEQLKEKARQTNTEIPKGLQDQENRLKQLDQSYKQATNSINIFGFSIPIDKMKEMAEQAKKTKEANDAYAQSLGFVSEANVQQEINMMTLALKNNAKQYENNPKIMAQLIEKIEVLRLKAKQAGIDVGDSFNEQANKIDKANKQYQENEQKVINLTGKQKILANVLGMSDQQFEKFAKTTGKIGSKLTDISNNGKAVLGFLTDTGIMSGKTAEALGGLLDGVGQVGAGFSELATNPIGGAMKILGGVVKGITSIFKLFAGDGVGEAIDREREFIDISEEMEQKIRDLEEQLGDTHAATSMLMDEVIKEAEINGDNFENYAKRVGEIVLDLDRGHINLKEFQESMGKSWNALLEEAQTLGMEGSIEMLATIRNMRNRGMEVAEIQEYVNEQIKSGIDAYTEYLDTFSGVSEITDKIKELEEELAGTVEGTQEYLDITAKLTEQHDLLSLGIEDISANFESMQLYAVGMIDALLAEGATYLEMIDAIGPALDQLTEYALLSGEEITGALKEITDMREFVNQNEELVTRITTTTKMMEALGNTSYLSLRLFNQFQEDAQVNFDELIEKGAEAEQAYQLVAPQLGKLLWYSQQYGYELDENTKKMIVEAEQHGVNMKAMIPPQEKMVSLLEELVRVMGGDIPYATDKFRDHFRDGMEGIRGETGRWGRDLDDIEGRFRKGLPDAVAGFDKDYQDHMTGHSIVTETGKWKYSLEEVNDILGRDLIDTASDLDDKYTHVLGDINHYLENTSKEGYMARLTFDEMVDELVVLKDAYDNLASQDNLTEGQQNVMDDYKRQIEELSSAIEESAPTLDNYREKFKDLKSELSGNIGVNTEMIGIARGLRSEGLSTDEIDKQIEGSLTSGAKGLADWIVTADDAETFTQSQEMIVGYFSALQAEGKSLTEIMAIMGDSFDAVAGKTITDEMAEDGFVLSDTFEQLYGLQQKMAENDGLIKGIEGLSTALHGMGDSMLYMTDETFVNFETAAVGAFNKLEDAGFSQKQSLQMISPLLKDLESYSAEYGYTLDESTAKLLEDAKASGIIKEEQKSDTELLIDANQQLADVMSSMVNIFSDMGEASPFNQMQDHAKKLQDEIRNMQKELEKLYKQKQQYTDGKVDGYISAASGFHGVLPKDTWFRLHRGEQVDVWTPEETRRIQATPAQRMNLSDTRSSNKAQGDIVFEHITVQSENGEEAVREFMTAIKGNKYGVQNLIRKVAH